MSLKLLLISVDGTLADSARQSSAGIRADLARLARQLHKRGVRMALWSNRRWAINGQPFHEHMSELAGVQIAAHGWGSDGSPSRRVGNSVAPVLANYGVQKHETILVGATNEDMLAGVNNGLLHIRADWYGQQSDYGFKVQTVDELARFCFVFALRQHPIFWKVEQGPLAMYSAGPFSTMTAAYALFGADARSAAKLGTGHPDFWFFLTISTLYFGGILEGTNYICTYPGHAVATAPPEDDSLEGVLTRLAKCFRMGFYHDLIVRHSAAAKSQYTKAGNRLFKPQIDSICLNRHPHKNLSPTPNKTSLALTGRNVLVVDDFCTSGRSLEAARAYLGSAHASIRLFSWLKTINTSYCQIMPPIALDAFASNVLAAEPPHIEHPYASGIFDAHASDELAQVFNLYSAWNWAAL